MHYFLCFNRTENMAAPGNPPGTIWAGMTGLQSARFDKLEVYDFATNSYADVALALADL